MSDKEAGMQNIPRVRANWSWTGNSGQSDEEIIQKLVSQGQTIKEGKKALAEIHREREEYGKFIQSIRASGYHYKTANRSGIWFSSRGIVY